MTFFHIYSIMNKIEIGDNMLETLTEQEFNDFSKKHICNTFFQSSYWGVLKQATDWKVHLVGIKENGTILAATLLLAKKIPLFHRYFFYAPRGFLIDYEDLTMVERFTQEIASYVKKQRGIFFKISPYVSYQERNINGEIVENGSNHKKLVQVLKKIGYQHNGFTIVYGKDLEPRWISVLDLENKTEEEILKQMRPTTRSSIINSYKHGLELVEIDQTRLKEFKDLMLHTGERRGFIDRPLSYYEKMYEAFHPTDNIKIMLVELNVVQYLKTLTEQCQELEEKIEPLKDATGAKGKRQVKEYTVKLESIKKRSQELQMIKQEKGDKIVIAGGLFMTYGTQVLSLFGASYQEYMKYDGQFFLNSEMIKYAIQGGYKQYNFYGITGEFQEDSPMFGLFDFKRGFHAQVVELIGEFTYITDSLYYHIYQLMFTTYKKLKKWRVKK